jgi:ABC-2 type transport system permease protein
LAHAGVVVAEIALVWIATCWLYRPPGFSITLATLAGVLFMLPLDMAIGNVLSIASPRRIDFGSLGRQRAPGATQFAALGTQLAMFAIAALVLMAARRYGKVWLATLCFLLLATAAFVAYGRMLRYSEKLALGRREIIIAELSRA